MFSGIVFKGGGVRGTAYAGALTAMARKGALSGIVRAAGASAGALTALLVGLGYTPDQIHAAISDLNFSSLQTGFSILRELESEGLYSNKPLFSWVTQMIGAKLHADCTFKELKELGFMDYHCIGSLPAIQQIQVFNAETTPDISVAWATVASMSIPGFFPKVQLPGIPYDIVDGGLLENYPIGLFQAEETIGLFLHSTAPAKPLPTRTLPEMAIAVFESALAAQDVDDLGDGDIMKRTIVIKTTVSSTDFGITDQQKADLFNEGVAGVESFLT